MENKWNFIQWTEVNTPLSSIQDVDLSIFSGRYEIPILEGDTVSFYANFDDISSLDMGDWAIAIFDCNLNQVSNDLGLSIDNITGSFNNFYSQFTVPALSRFDNYYLVVYDTYLDTAYYVSNPLRNISQREADEKTFRVDYSHTKNIYNYFYENLTGFSNKFRLHLNISKPIDKEDADGYTLINGTFKTARSTSGRTKEFITLWFDEQAHNAFHAMTKHDNIIIDNSSWLRNDNDEYEVEWNENYNRSEGSVRLDDTAYAISNKMC